MSSRNRYADELRRAIRHRTGAIRRITSELRGAIPAARVSVHKVFGLLDGFPGHVDALVDDEIERSSDDGALTTILENILRHLTLVADFIETHLSHGERHELSQALSDEVANELASLDLGHYNVILSHGTATNFITYFVDLNEHINGRIDLAGPEVSDADRYFALFVIPRIEGAGIYWKPVLIGHEVAHVYVAEMSITHSFDLQAKFDFASAGGIQSPRSQNGTASDRAAALFAIARDWAKELLCDAHAFHRYGPSSIAAIGEYLTAIGGLNIPTTSHPPVTLRTHLMLSWLGHVTDARLKRLIQPWSDQAAGVPTYDEPWAQFLADLFVTHGDKLHGLATTCPASAYDFRNRTEAIHFIADRLASGIAGSERLETGTARIQKPDVVNAAWLARSEEADTPIDPLARKALEGISFVDRWIEAGGGLPELPKFIDAAPRQDSASGALSEASLLQRLATGEEDGGIVATPLLQLPKGSALDLRLGSRFIVFRRTRDASFDPLRSDTDSRSIQIYQQLSWTEQIVLHPQELLLAATLEYLVLPNDLTAQVITRSSYGRLGLLSATAVQVHPNFHGCLTLELVNLSNLPLVLTPGERVAQLVAWTTEPVQESNEKYRCPVGPEFSKARTDAESDILRRIREF